MKNLFILLCLLLPSCQVITVPETTKFIRKDVENYLPKIEKEKGQVCFYRLKALVGSGYSPDVFVNNEKVGEISNNSYFCKNFSPNYYNVRVEIPLQNDLNLNINVSKNKRKFILITYESIKYIKEIDETISLGYLYTIIHKDKF